MKLWSLFLAGCVALGMASVSSAGPITDLYNTGVDASGNPLPDGSTDPHYNITASVADNGTDAPDPLGPPQVRTSAGGFPIGPWLGDNSISAWVTPNTDHSGDGVTGTDTYTTTFTLPANFATASITGQWSVDNEGSDILINGVSTGQANNNSFQAWTPFSVTSGFVPGVNTISFLVHNDGGPAGLRVEMSGTYTASAVPEPASLTLLGLGGLGLVLARRRQLA